MRPRLLDLYCCAGGAATGLHRAGFDVTGVDIVPRPRYPFHMIQNDALGLDPRWIADNFDAVWASPPCQGYTALRHAPGAVGAPRLIDETKALLEATGLPWIIENVEEAAWAMPGAITLCGTMFGLGVEECELRRHRLFIASFPIAPPGPCKHAKPVVGVYGGHARRRAASAGGRSTRDVWLGGHRQAMAGAMGVDWMTCAEMSEAIPPAYSQHLGGQLLIHLTDAQSLI